MNINKIREALEAAIIEPGLRKAALAELDKAPKVLTDEEIEKLRLSREREDGRRASSKYGYGFADGLRYARDSGYLAPSAGLTVEEAEQIAVDARIEIDEIAWKSPPISYEKEFRSILKRRLTAAIEAKTNSK